MWTRNCLHTRWHLSKVVPFFSCLGAHWHKWKFSSGYNWFCSTGERWVLDSGLYLVCWGGAGGRRGQSRPGLALVWREGWGPDVGHFWKLENVSCGGQEDCFQALLILVVDGGVVGYHGWEWSHINNILSLPRQTWSPREEVEVGPHLCPGAWLPLHGLSLSRWGWKLGTVAY